MADLKETILSVAGENRALRWVIVLLAFSIGAMAMALVLRRPSPVWVVSERGTIYRGDKKIVNWEPLEVSRRALEILLVPTDNREALVAAYFDGSLTASINASKPKETFISFQIKKVTEEKGGDVVVVGVLMRPDKPRADLTINLEQRARTELNPFGLVVKKTTLQVETN